VALVESSASSRPPLAKAPAIAAITHARRLPDKIFIKSRSPMLNLSQKAKLSNPIGFAHYNPSP
jgi:hypothetical protein